MNKLKLSKELYSIESICEVKVIFSDLCDIRLTEDNIYYYLEFSKVKFDLIQTINEFENYLIGIINKYEY